MTVVFFDGVCGLCDRFVRFLLRHDRSGRLRFAALQGALAQNALTARGYDPASLDTVYAVADWQGPRERVLRKSRAVLHAFAELGGGWTSLAWAAAVVPRLIADVVYDVIARRRYRLFGRFDRCIQPSAAWRERFLE